MSELSMDRAAGIAAAVAAGRVGAVEVTREALARIAHEDGAVNAWVIVDEAGALAQAEAMDARRAAGEALGPLAGVPLGVKDLQDVRGLPTRQGSVLYADAPAAEADDPHVARLRAADAVILGKTTTSEFGMDSATSTPAHGVTRNPWDLTRTPGGSSGGSAAAVAAGVVPVATASDGGGSIRSPASFCGLLGHKPTHGLVGRPAADECSVLGVLSTTVADTRLLLEVMAGPTAGDRTSLLAPIPLARALPAGLRAGIATDLGYAPVEPAVRDVVTAAVSTLVESAGMHVRRTDVKLSNVYPEWVREQCALLTAALVEAGALPDRRADLHRVTSQAVEIGLAVDVDVFARAVAARASLERELAALFTDIDVLLLPTTACVAYGADDNIPTVIDGRDATDTGAEPFTMFANWSWIPATSVPAGRTPQGLPVGLQLVGRRGEDALLLALAERLEQVAPWPRTTRA